MRRDGQSINQYIRPRYSAVSSHLHNYMCVRILNSWDLLYLQDDADGQIAANTMRSGGQNEGGVWMDVWMYGWMGVDGSLVGWVDG